MCNLVYIQGATHQPCHSEVLFSTMANSGNCVLGHHLGIIPKTSTSMFSICPVFKRLLGSNYSSTHKREVILYFCVFFLWYILMTSCICVEAENMNTVFTMAPVQLCKIVLVFNGVHQFFANAWFYCFPHKCANISVCYCWTTEADKVFTEHTGHHLNSFLFHLDLQLSAKWVQGAG